MPNRICDMFVIARPYRPPYYVTVDTKTTPSGNVIMTTILCIVIYSEICYLWIKIRHWVERWPLLCGGKINDNIIPIGT